LLAGVVEQALFQQRKCLPAQARFQADAGGSAILPEFTRENLLLSEQPAEAGLITRETA
jgi:hypothetical protein